MNIYLFWSMYLGMEFLGFSGGSDGKESACNAGDLGSIPGLGRSPGGGGNPLQHSCLENSMDNLWGRKELDNWVTKHTEQHMAALTRQGVSVQRYHLTCPSAVYKDASFSPSLTTYVLVFPFSTTPRIYLIQFIFNWSIVDLQYYTRFRCTTQWFNIFGLYPMYSYYNRISAMCCAIYPCDLFYTS